MTYARSSDTDDTEKVSKHWGEERTETRAHNWLAHPVAQACINLRVSGDPSVDRLTHWRRQFLPRQVGRALSLGCGFGPFERHALQAGIASHIEAYDASHAAIAQAQACAAQAGLGDRVSYAVADLNVIDLPTDRYDAIFAMSSLHHVRELERLFEGCRRALRQGGLLFLEEYVGPARFQSSPATTDKINKVMSLLPERYRRSVFTKGVRESYANPPLSWFDKNDPSEAIRSDEIMPTLRQFFEVVDWRPYGGALLHMLLSGTAGNYDPQSDADVALIRMLAFLEEELEKAGALSTDFAAAVARPLP